MNSLRPSVTIPVWRQGEKFELGAFTRSALKPQESVGILHRPRYDRQTQAGATLGPFGCAIGFDIPVGSGHWEYRHPGRLG